jgi:hypothetical protein
VGAPPPAARAASTSRDLRRIARRAAHDQGGRLLDWRLLLFRGAGVVLQARYLLSNGTARNAVVKL